MRIVNFLKNCIKKKSKNKYKLFFEKSNEMVCIINRQNLKFIKVNETFCKKLGYTKEYLLNNTNTLKSLVHLKDLDYTINQINNSNINFTNNYKTKNDKYKRINWNCMYFKTKIFIMCFDITDNYDMIKNFNENKLLLEENEKIALLGNWVYDTNDNTFVLSNGLKKIYELPIEKDVSYDLYMDINHPDDKEIIKLSMDTCKNTKKPFELVHRLLINNKIKYIFVKCIYVDPNFLVGVSQDISKQKFIELDLIQAKHTAERASEMKTAFVANISHEIRTPINGIICMTDLLKKTKLDEEQSEFLNTVIHSSGILLSIINNVLDFSKIEAGKIELDYLETDLQEIISRINNLFEIPIKQKNLILKIYIDNKVPKFIITDPVKLQQILTNLINNSIKFTEYGSVIIVIKLDNSNLRFEIKDTGIGISEENQTKLFKAFMQADSSTTRNFGGTGLGLLICKNLVELMRGKIGLISNLGIGTTVWFAIPIKELKNKEPENLEKVDNLEKNFHYNNKFDNMNFDKIKSNKKDYLTNNMQTVINSIDPLIIVVEDNHVNQFVVKKMMEKLGYTNVIIYNNGKIALDNLLEFKDKIKPALILMDLHLPIMDGYTCTEKLRENGILTPIIALTANAMSGEKQKCISIGMNDFILKPIDLKELKNKIFEWIT